MYGLVRGGRNEMRKDYFALDHSAKIQAQPPHLSPLLSTHTSSQEASLTDEWVMDDAGPANQGVWLDDFTGW
jgi:hypothetical protein